jgi:hypothetical protein
LKGCAHTLPEDNLPVKPIVPSLSSENAEILLSRKIDVDILQRHDVESLLPEKFMKGNGDEESLSEPDRVAPGDARSVDTPDAAVGAAAWVRVLIATMDLGAGGYNEGRGRQLLDQFEQAPGVQSASLAEIIPLKSEIARELPGSHRRQ